jgi:hypothetical protein
VCVSCQDIRTAFFEPPVCKLILKISNTTSIYLYRNSCIYLNNYGPSVLGSIFTENKYKDASYDYKLSMPSTQCQRLFSTLSVCCLETKVTYKLVTSPLRL